MSSDSTEFCDVAHPLNAERNS